MNLPLTIHGFRIMTNPLLCKQVMVRHCRSKKHRIQKKWMKNPKNWSQVPDDSIYWMSGNVLIMHPTMKDRLLKEVITLPWGLKPPP